MPSSKARKARRQQRSTEQSPRVVSQQYKYERLPSASSIRLLELLPTRENLECTLQTVDLEDDPKFDALSYSWANPITIREKPILTIEEHDRELRSLASLQSFPTARYPKTINVDPGMMSHISYHKALPYIDVEHGRERCRSIQCNGLALPITDTLYSALLELRHITLSKAQAEASGLRYEETLPMPRSYKIWIDQICIDQDNIDERSSQVPLMNKVFASAQYVFAWIGEADSLGLAAFEAVVSREKESDPEKNIESEGLTYERIAKAHKKMYIMTALLSRQWFRRAWVVQETVFAKRMFVWFGHLFVDWWMLFDYLQNLDERDIANMARFTASLIRREPSGQMSRKLALLSAKTSNQVPEGTVTYEEVLSYIQGAISFMRGAASVKKQLGLQTFIPQAVKADNILDTVTESRFANLVTGFLIGPEKGEASLPGGLTTNMRWTDRKPSQNVASGTSPSRKWDRISAPYLDVVTGVPDGNDLRLNASFFQHDLKPAKLMKPTPVSLFYLITQFRGVGASDPRDKVFAFLHLATETPNLKANYRVSTEAVFTAAAKLLLNQHNLDILSHVQDPADTKIPGLPSWVPDFSVPLGRTPFVAHDGFSPYFAGGDSAQMSFYLTVGDKDAKDLYEVMAVTGYPIDTVAELEAVKGCSFTRAGDLAVKTPKFYAKHPGPLWCQKSQIVCRMAESPGHPRVEALWRTLIGDYCFDTYPAPTTAGFGFSEWVSSHIHHSHHILDMLKDHFKAVGYENATKGIQELQAKQKRKHNTYIKLLAEEFGGYLCYDCTTDLWNEKMLDFDKDLKKSFEASGVTPAMVPARYMPDGDRLSATIQCNRTVPPRIDPSLAMQCPPLTKDELKNFSGFENRMRDIKAGRRLFRTKGHLLGLGPKSTQPGDEVWVLLKAKVPFVLRPIDGGKAPKRFTLVGEAYVHGYMDTEALWDKKFETIGLV